MSVLEPASTRTVADIDGLDLEHALTGLHELLVMSLTMLQRHDVDGVIDVLARGVESATGCTLVHVNFQRHQEWTTLPPGEPTRPAEPIPPTGERVFVQDHGDSWTSTTSVTVANGVPGQLVLRSSTRPDPEQLFVIERLGDLLRTALAEAESHERDRRRARELEAANNEMARTVAVLKHREGVLEEFARLATSGTELDVATSLSRFTGSTVVLRDGFGHETTRITVAGRYQPVLERTSLEAVIGGRPELGTIELEVPSDKEQDDALFALQYAGVALGLLRAHAAAMNELENGLSRDLLDDLLEGLPNDVAVDRASAQGHDLGVPHDLIVSAWSSDRGQRGHDRDVDHLRRALARQRLPCLVGRNQGLVVALTYRGVDIGRLFDDLSRGYGDTNGVIAKGEPFNSPQQIPRAYEQAQRALRARQQSPKPYGSIAYADLGVDRLLALDANADEVERLVSDWLGDLLSYDRRHGTELVLTLAAYLDHGGKYADTAAALSIHRNTLRYRLSRITEISGHDLTDVETKLNLHLAARAWRLRRAPVGEPPRDTVRSGTPIP
ncbi:PucR family transcriptional regulator [Nocardioides jensenii]|uniref:PucR family transcriptional regulator n=1 Tax=Nocardioides jensenii TaxID=1843 RepID=UPI00082F5064|nr:helix-turn-helix domain-containing protein [Nocardioides jensenii]